MTARTSAHFLLATAIASALLLTGCGSEFVPASGIVKVDGAPAGGVVVVFHPASGSGETATSRTDDSGRYSLMTKTAGDGTRPGEYVVTAVWMEEKPLPPAEVIVGDSENATTSIDRLKGRYSAKDKTPLKVSVPADGAELSPIELSTK